MGKYRQGFGLEIRFIDPLQVITASNYNTVANFHTLQITAAHAKPFQSTVTSHFLVTDLNIGDSSASDYVISSQTPLKLSHNSVSCSSCPPYNSSARTNRKYSSSVVAPVVSTGTCLFVNGHVCLLIKNLLPSSGCCFLFASRSLPSRSTHYSIMFTENMILQLQGWRFSWQWGLKLWSSGLSHGGWVPVFRRKFLSDYNTKL
jgi:hypothetical protein